jgi:hypothetical protein
MSTLCKGCGTVVKRSGLYPHFQKSRNPLCESYRVKLDGGTLLLNNESGEHDVAASGAHVFNTEEGDMVSESGVENLMTERQSGRTS